MSSNSGVVADYSPSRPPRPSTRSGTSNRRSSVSFAGGIPEGERSSLLYGHGPTSESHMPKETSSGRGRLFRSASQAHFEADEHAQGPNPEVACPFRHADPSYYPEPLSEVPRDARRLRLTKVQSSRSLMDPPGQRREMWDMESSEQGILSDPLLRMRGRMSQGAVCIEPPAPGAVCLDPPAPSSASTPQLRARRLSHGDALKGKVSNSLLPEAGRPLVPTRTSAASRRSSASGVVMRDSRSLSHRSSNNSAYEEAVSQGYALPSIQGLSRRSWYENGSTSIADRIAVQAHKSGAGKPLTKHDARASSTTSPQLASPKMGMGMVDAPPAKGIRGVLESLFK
ncbi:hypothetical protein DUNSADRAFT_12315 [Dunaliella salina]|uniref:Encoded protein n=1 Tax=Dunaliella salina TaxID=3046 RepID=A0ABQ7GBN5_DUNSA|nr:hypothetical protein DUNSADRAFT_12315 [Dunaliella salina]|eukprot:KAF5832000.1 hypothetical protein DUNSADRAFT_12315 [Dunaliella salina]